MDTERIQYPNDYFNINSAVEVSAHYTFTDEDHKSLIEELKKSEKFPKPLLSQIRVNSVIINCSYRANETADLEICETVEFEKRIFDEYYEENGKILKTSENSEVSQLDLQDYFNSYQENYFYRTAHKVVLWKSSSKYLILDDIDLKVFAAKPSNISIPLLNCFKLSGLKEKYIKSLDTELNSSVKIANLESKLSTKVSAYIKKVWPEHPISVLFKINNNNISFLIEDKGVKYNAKTPRQRSDGFRQFISFLLTLSVENFNKELTNTILLIDEPETHLHPLAQHNLLKELISITQNDKNNLVIFATHSNYLIDKKNLERNFKVEKVKNSRTKITPIRKKECSFAEVNYEVFKIPTTDYHNELFGFIMLMDKTKLDNLPKCRKWYNEKKQKEDSVSQSEYIRHWIHHPENKRNQPVTDDALKKSIDKLRELKSEIVNKNDS